VRQEADTRLDGNAIGGELLELFGVEMTLAEGTCASCGNRAPMAEVDVFVHAPGIVARCRGCESVLLRIVHGRDRTWLDVSGVRSLEIRR